MCVYGMTFQSGISAHIKIRDEVKDKKKSNTLHDKIHYIGVCVF